MRRSTNGILYERHDRKEFERRSCAESAFELECSYWYGYASAHNNAVGHLRVHVTLGDTENNYTISELYMFSPMVWKPSTRFRSAETLMDISIRAPPRPVSAMIVPGCATLPLSIDMENTMTSTISRRFTTYTMSIVQLYVDASGTPAMAVVEEWDEEVVGLLSERSARKLAVTHHGGRLPSGCTVTYNPVRADLYQMDAVAFKAAATLVSSEGDDADETETDTEIAF